MDVYKEENKSNFGLGQIIDPIGLFGGKPIWQVGSTKDELLARNYTNQQKAAQASMMAKMRLNTAREDSQVRADAIRSQLRSTKRSAQVKSGLIIGGIVVVALLIGTITTITIIRKKG